MSSKSRLNDAIAKPVDIKKVKFIRKPWTKEEIEKEKMLNKQKEMLMSKKK